LVADDRQDWYIAEIDGVVTHVQIENLGHGKVKVTKDILNRFDYRIIDASDIICRSDPEKASLIIDALFFRYSR
jgi:hypothetical protein